jgi:hypothetical protein
VGIAIVDARRKRTENLRRHEEREDRHVALRARCERESTQQQRCRGEVYDGVLVPFSRIFERMKNVDLAALESMALPVVAELPVIELMRVQLGAAGLFGATIGGLGSGAGMGAAAYASVGAFAAASTGTSISALSGAAATNATLAFLGGGSLATGGGGIAAGTMVLGGIVTVPVVLTGAAFVTFHGRRERRKQSTTSLELDLAEAEFSAAARRTALVLVRSRQVRSILRKLAAATAARLADFAALVEANDDYATYTDQQRRQVATLVGLVTAIVAVMAAPLVDDTGMVSDLLEQTLAAAQNRLDDLDGDEA